MAPLLEFGESDKLSVIVLMSTTSDHDMRDLHGLALRETADGDSKRAGKVAFKN